MYMEASCAACRPCLLFGVHATVDPHTAFQQASARILPAPAPVDDVSISPEVLPRVPVAARRPGVLLRIVGRAYMSRAEVPLMRKKRRSRQSARASAVAIDAATSDVGQEVVERRAFCLEDYVTAARNPSKTLSASLFMFFATLFSTVALGSLIEKQTLSRIGLTEYLYMNSLAGIIHSLLGTQPLLVIRPTGPVTAIIIKLSGTSDHFGFNFHHFLAATGVWVGLLLAAMAVARVSRYAYRLTPFTHEIFACFVCSIYLSDGISSCIARLEGSEDSFERFGTALFNLNLAAITFGGSAVLAGAVSWRLLPRSVRAVIADYAVTIAVVFTTAASLWSDIAAPRVERISMPSTFSPTCHHTPSDFECLHQHVPEPSLVTAPPRAWFVGFPVEPFCWLVALAAALPISFFFFIDQSISSLLCQLPSMGLRRGTYMHVSLLIIGVFNAVGPAFGLPFVTGSLPHSPQFVRSLTLARTREEGAEAEGEEEEEEEEVASTSPLQVAESRVAPLLMYTLMGLPLLSPGLLKLIPEAAIDGILAYVGYEGIVSTDLYSRVLLLCTPRCNIPTRYAGLPLRVLHGFTAIQLAMLALCWAVNLSPAGLCVAFVVLSLIPLRERLLPRYFSTEQLAVLDGGSLASPLTPQPTPPKARPSRVAPDPHMSHAIVVHGEAPLAAAANEETAEVTVGDQAELSARLTEPDFSQPPEETRVSREKVVVDYLD